MVHVGQVIEGKPLLDGAQHGAQIALVAFGDEDRVGEALAPCEHCLIPGRIALLLIKRHTAHVGVERNACSVETCEMRCHNNDGLTLVFKQVFKPLKGHELLNRLLVGFPKRAVIDGSARKADIDTMCQRATLGLGKLGKAEPQVRLDDMATLRNGEPEDSGNDFRKSFAHGHRQILHRPNHTDPELGKENVHFLSPACLGCAPAGVL